MIHRILSPILLSVALVAFGSAPAWAAKSPITPTGNDVSWPQCGKALPSGQAFGIVGVNDGLANTTNPCLADQLAWANKSTGAAVLVPKVALYVNTANPGGLNTASWPSNNTDPAGNATQNPYGTCDHGNTTACAYQYGWNRAVEDATIRGVANPASYVWWLDVETGNSWDTTTGGSTRNVADLEGMTDYFQKSLGTKAGLYSTSAQWSSITGTVAPDSNLNGLMNWRPGARSLAAAKSNCSLPPLTPGGKVVLAQYVSTNLDYDYACGS